VSVNGTLVEEKMLRFKGEYAHFSFYKCPIYTHDGASAKFGPNSHETDISVRTGLLIYSMRKYTKFSPHMRRSLVIYDFAPDPSKFPNILNEENFIFFLITALA
jgi:hypothetical protein